MLGLSPKQMAMVAIISVVTVGVYHLATRKMGAGK